MQALDEFGQRWRALKPQEIKDWSPPEVEGVFRALCDWREQFEEHKKQVGTARIVCLGSFSHRFHPPSPSPCADNQSSETARDTAKMMRGAEEAFST